MERQPNKGPWVVSAHSVQMPWAACMVSLWPLSFPQRSINFPFNYGFHQIPNSPPLFSCPEISILPWWEFSAGEEENDHCKMLMAPPCPFPTTPFNPPQKLVQLTEEKSWLHVINGNSLGILSHTLQKINSLPPQKRNPTARRWC